MASLLLNGWVMGSFFAVCSFSEQAESITTSCNCFVSNSYARNYIKNVK